MAGAARIVLDLAKPECIDINAGCPVPKVVKTGAGSSLTRLVGSSMRPARSQPRYHLLHPLLPHVGVNLGGGDRLMAQQGLDVHQLRPGVEQIGGVGVAQLVGRNLLVDGV